ncbi:MAG: LicD family protein [Bacteroides sp.]|nr:LicD family protein [Bacteroides sp.]
MTQSSPLIDKETQTELRNRFNPDGSLLRRHQMLLLDMLKKIDRLCRENNIHYWLSSGTCIGALRHGGFIPWDDDVDIEMFESDFRKLRKVMLDNPDSDMAWQDSSTDIEYVQPFAKIRDTHTIIHEIPDVDKVYKHRGVFIDVFVLRPSSSLRLYKFSGIFQVNFLYRVQNITNRTLRRAILRFSHNMITKGLFTVLSAISAIGSKGQYRHRPGTAYCKPRFIDDIRTSRMVRFEDTELPVPINAEHYLETIYGDFRQLPPFDKITPHISEIEYL